MCCCSVLLSARSRSRVPPTNLIWPARHPSLCVCVFICVFVCICCYYIPLTGRSDFLYLFFFSPHRFYYIILANITYCKKKKKRNGRSFYEKKKHSPYSWKTSSWPSDFYDRQPVSSPSHRDNTITKHMRLAETTACNFRQYTILYPCININTCQFVGDSLSRFPAACYYTLFAVSFSTPTRQATRHIIVDYTRCFSRVYLFIFSRNGTRVAASSSLRTRKVQAVASPTHTRKRASRRHVISFFTSVVIFFPHKTLQWIIIIPSPSHRVIIIKNKNRCRNSKNTKTRLIGGFYTHGFIIRYFPWKKKKRAVNTLTVVK